MDCLPLGRQESALNDNEATDRPHLSVAFAGSYSKDQTERCRDFLRCLLEANRGTFARLGIRACQFDVHNADGLAITLAASPISRRNVGYTIKVLRAVAQAAFAKVD